MMDNQSPRPQKRSWAFNYFALAFFLSWLFWIPAAALSQSESSFPFGILSLLGGFGPSISGVVMVYRTRDETGRKGFWQRVFSFKRIGGGWFALIFSVFPILSILSILVEELSGRSVPYFPYLAALATEPLLLLWLPVIALQVALIGPLSEELGWRGYALDELQTRWNALISSLVLGFFWSMWHLPLFFIRDEASFYFEWGFGTVLFWLFLLRMTLLSVLMTWIFNNNRRSIMSSILFHFAYNFTFSFVYPIPETMHLSGTVMLLFIVLVIVIIWGPQTMTRRAVRMYD